MSRVKIAVAIVLVAAIMLTAGSWMSGADQPATASARLPKPKTEGGMPLMEALKKRHSSRQFAGRKLPDQVLSNMLWAAFGVNRPDGRRTAPSAVNWQEIDIYVAMADGLWLFDAGAHDLKLVVQKDVRALTGKQGFVKDAPVNLIFVADYAKMPKRSSQADKDFYSATDTGYISQNVYLFCASEGLATVVRGMVDRPALAAAMQLREDQRIILAQSVGYAPEPSVSQPK
jgi:nitroreductase